MEKKKNAKLFSFGTFFTILKKAGSPPEFKNIGSDLLLDGIEKAKKTLQKKGKDQGRGYIVMYVGGSNVGFGITKEGVEKEIFFWNYEDLFTIEVVKNIQEIMPQQPRTTKLFLVLEETQPYYYHYQNKKKLMENDISKEEIEYIKSFEEGLGLLYDY